MKQLLQSEDTKSSRRKQGKRLLATFETCKLELRPALNKLFLGFNSALAKATSILAMIPPESRSRGLEPTVLQSCFAEVVFDLFENNKAFYGAYKRLIIRTDGYLILFKKLNDKGFPMNTKTNNVQNILNQSQILDLFSESDYNDEPILYFGYQKDKTGQYCNIQLVYIDEGNIVFTVTEEDIQYEKTVVGKTTYNQNKLGEVKEASPKLKNNLKAKKA